MTALAKNQEKEPRWVQTLSRLIETRGMNPRQLSLMAGLNPTAVRDMLSGRARYPRYDTLQALARALDTTPAYLMGDQNAHQEPGTEQLDLLTEIIARLQEVAEDMQRELSPRELAMMATTIYRQIQNYPTDKSTPTLLQTQARTLIAYASNNKQIVVKKR
ncbi:MAG: helix-turn-helix transcriptional regulator [Alphaproteobacteria bacterium]